MKNKEISGYGIFLLLIVAGVTVGAFFARVSPLLPNLTLLAKDETVLKTAFISFIKPCLFVWLAGFSRFSFAASCTALCYRGALLGFMIGCILKEYGLLKGVLTSFCISFPQNLLFFSMLVFLSVQAHKHSAAQRKLSKKYLFLPVVFLPWSFLSAMADKYITSILINFTIR